MCGIFGGISIKEPLATLEHMERKLVHRGPDDRGIYIEGAIALGHRRLSIIDLVSGHQPMFSSDKKQALVYNGEIYNFKEIRRLLQKQGHQFNTASDTEVIINAYREWGYACLEKLNGMFAFALWDTNTNKLWLARDRIGKKPLYYLNASGVFYFASEAKALTIVPEYAKRYDFSAIDQYLTFRYVPSNRTLYKGITKLPPGHWLLVDNQARICSLTQWWDIPRKREEAYGKKININRYYDEFSALFSSAVRQRLIADVPLGLFLSSGIDSSSIALEMAKIAPPTCISIGFGEETDELSTTNLLAQKIGADYHPFLMREIDFDLFGKTVASMDEPYGDPIILPTFLLANRAAKKVKVILTGDGGDEALGGYIHHDYFRKFPQSMPLFIIKLLSSLISVVPPSCLNALFDYPAALGQSGKQRIKNLLSVYPDALRSYLSFATIFTQHDKEGLYAEDFTHAVEREHDPLHEEMRAHFSRSDTSALDKVMQWDLKTWFPNQTLMKLDRLSMAHSLEGRCPYADYRLIEFLLKIPYGIFNACSHNKRVVRILYQKNASFLPVKKQAFYLPMHNKFNAKAEELIQATLNRKAMEEIGFFRYSFVESLLRNRAASPLLTDKQIMCLVVLLVWLKMQE